MRLSRGRQIANFRAEAPQGVRCLSAQASRSNKDGIAEVGEKTHIAEKPEAAVFYVG